MNEKMKRLQAELTSLVKETQPLAEASKAGTLTDEQSTRYDELVEQIQKSQGEFAAEEKRLATGHAIPRCGSGGHSVS